MFESLFRYGIYQVGQFDSDYTNKAKSHEEQV